MIGSEADKRIQATKESYSSLAESEGNETLAVGRREFMADREPIIFEDVISKLQIATGETILSVGCGCGKIAELWLAIAKELSLNLCLNDFDKVISRLKERKYSEELLEGSISFVAGLFPHDVHKEINGPTFDAIDVYSVLHCTDHPSTIIDAAVSLLKPGGRVLFGDIPNLDKKGRFLMSEHGRKIEAEYRGCSVSDIENFRSISDFKAHAVENGSLNIDDDFLLGVLRKYRAVGFDAYLLNQNPSLPFSLTREDLLLIAPYE